MKIKIVLVAIAGLLLASIAPLHADNMAEAKKIYEDKQDAVIWITGVAKISQPLLSAYCVKVMVIRCGTGMRP